jgi:hypothetical protein
LPREAFTFTKDWNVYVRPKVKTLKTTGKVHDGKTLLYRASQARLRPIPVETYVLPEHTIAHGAAAHQRRRPRPHEGRALSRLLRMHGQGLSTASPTTIWMKEPQPQQFF